MAAAATTRDNDDGSAPPTPTAAANAAGAAATTFSTTTPASPRAARFARAVKDVSEAFGLPNAPAPDKVFSNAYLPPKADRMVAK